MLYAVFLIGAREDSFLYGNGRNQKSRRLRAAMLNWLASKIWAMLLPSNTLSRHFVILGVCDFLFGKKSPEPS